MLNFAFLLYFSSTKPNRPLNIQPTEIPLNFCIVWLVVVQSELILKATRIWVQKMTDHIAHHLKLSDIVIKYSTSRNTNMYKYKINIFLYTIIQLLETLTCNRLRTYSNWLHHYYSLIIDYKLSVIDYMPSNH